MNSSPQTSSTVTVGSLIAAFAAIYFIWGSTYLAIRYSIETLPPFLMAGVRFIIAGTVVYCWGRSRGAEPPNREHWKSALIIGGLLLLGGNGGVVWSEQWVPSGIAALIVTTVPLWMVLIEWLRPKGVKPSLQTAVGLVVGFGGVAVLVGPTADLGFDLFPALVLMFASLSWSIGSIYSRSAVLPGSPRLVTGMQMLTGGFLLLAAGLIRGELAMFSLSEVSVRSLLGLVYLIVFGSIIAFSAYVWLLRVSTPAKVSTYAFVNPGVAVFLGWALADEPMTPSVVMATSLIILAVVLVTLSRKRKLEDPKGGKRPDEEASLEAGLAGCESEVV